MRFWCGKETFYYIHNVARLLNQLPANLPSEIQFIMFSVPVHFNLIMQNNRKLLKIMRTKYKCVDQICVRFDFVLLLC